MAPFIVGVMVTIFTPYKGALASYWLLAVLALISSFPALVLTAPTPQKSEETASTASSKLQKIRSATFFPFENSCR